MKAPRLHLLGLSVAPRPFFSYGQSGYRGGSKQPYPDTCAVLDDIWWSFTGGG